MRVLFPQKYKRNRISVLFSSLQKMSHLHLIFKQPEESNKGKFFFKKNLFNINTAS